MTDGDRWLLAATLIRRSLTSSETDTYDDGPRLYWQGGGYDCESMTCSPEEHALLEEIWTKPWCHDCERFLLAGESIWSVGSMKMCDPHWQEYKERAESRGSTVKEVESDD